MHFRTKLSTLIAVIAIMMSSSAAAQEQSSSGIYFAKKKTDHWTINVQGFASLGSEDIVDYKTGPFDDSGHGCICPEKYWGISVNAQRKFYVIRNTGFWLSPGAGLTLSWPLDTTEKNYTEFGLELSGLTGYTFTNNNVGLDLFVGVVGRVGLMKAGHGDQRYWPGTGYARAGFSLSVGHISLTGAFDYAFTCYRHCDANYEVEKTNALTFGIGYSF